jgi:hypothetical protein
VFVSFVTISGLLAAKDHQNQAFFSLLTGF